MRACVDCGTTANLFLDYMVEDVVWSRAGFPTRTGLCCLQCLESRLGRPLVEADFTGVRINASIDLRLKMLHRDHTPQEVEELWRLVKPQSFGLTK